MPCVHLVRPVSCWTRILSYGTMYPRDLHRTSWRSFIGRISCRIFIQMLILCTHIAHLILPYSIGQCFLPTQRFLGLQMQRLQTLACQTALDFMCAASPANHHLTYMVFAKQRLLPMLAKQHGLSICSLMELPELFSSGQDWFTHIWGFKQQMHQSKHLYHEFCTRCAKRLQNTFSISRADTVSAF